jgi:hypothetical protein
VRWNSISAIGTLTDVNTSSGDCLIPIPARCKRARSLRTTVEDAPGDDGALVFPPLDGAEILTIGGILRIRSATSESGYLSAVDTLLATIDTALLALKAAPDDLVHSGGTLSVWLYAHLDEAWDNALMNVTFSLVVEG